VGRLRGSKELRRGEGKGETTFCLYVFIGVTTIPYLPLHNDFRLYILPRLWYPRKKPLKGDVSKRTLADGPLSFPLGALFSSDIHHHVHQSYRDGAFSRVSTSLGTDHDLRPPSHRHRQHARGSSGGGTSGKRGETGKVDGEGRGEFLEFSFCHLSRVRMGGLVSYMKRGG
jgi:hypothetical protein